MPRINKIAFFIYLICLGLAILSINSVLKVDKVDVGEVDEDKKVEKTYEVTAKVTVQGKDVASVKLLNSDSIYDALDELREDGLVSFEFTSYVDHIVLDEVNSVSAPKGKSWLILLNGLDVTNDFRQTNITKDSEISVVLN